MGIAMRALLPGPRHPAAWPLCARAEVIELVELLHPTAPEAAARQAAVDEVAEVVASIWPKAQTVVFGSFATGG